MISILCVAATLGVPQAVAQTIVNIILGAGTLATVLAIISTLVTGGTTAWLLLGWAGFKATVQRKAKQGLLVAVAW